MAANLLQKYVNFKKLVEAAETHAGPLSTASLVKQIIDVRRKNRSVGAEDFFGFRLYDRAFLRNSLPEDFVGWRWAEQFSKALNPRTEVLPAWDKLVFHALASSYGLATATTKAVYSEAAKVPLANVHHIQDPKALGYYLRSDEAYPLFCKPAYSQQGFGAFRLDGFLRESDAAQLPDGSEKSIDSIVAEITDTTRGAYTRGSRGYLLQEPVTQNLDITAFTRNTAPSSLRVVCLNSTNGPVIHRVLWKCCSPPNIVDNFSKGKYGNLVADVKDGIVVGAINGVWPYADYLTTYPQTGEALSGFAIPDWKRVEQLALLTCDAFPGFGVLHLDIVVATDGPCLLEVNDIGAVMGYQLVGRGLLADGGREFLKEYGDPNVAPWIKGL